MTEPITSDKVLAMAIDLEKTGQVFYESLAVGCGKWDMAALCVRLAKAEADHASTFAQMRNSLPKDAQPAFLSDEQAELFYSMLKDAVIPKPVVVSKVALKGELKDAVGMAIRMEQESIRFYKEILRDVRQDQVQAINKIIREEQKHLEDLWAITV